MNVREANSKEVHGIEYLAALDCQLRKSEPYLKDRLQSIPGAWQKYRTSVSFIEKVIDALYLSIPEKMLRHMRMLCDCGEVIIRPKPVTRNGDVQIVLNEDIKTVINKAMENECAMCLEFGPEVKRCQLRKSLMNIAPPEHLKKDGSCPYQDVAMRHEAGKYI